MENTFSKARFDLYRNGEAMQLAHDVVKACNDANAVTLKIDAATTDLSNAANTTDLAFDGSTGSSLTEEIIALDQLRDNDVMGIKGIASSYRKHYTPNLKAAGKLIEQSLNKYSQTIHRENLATETTILRNWYTDATTDVNLKAALALLNLKDWADHLNATNEDFNTKYLLRSQQLGNDAQLASVGDLLPSLKKKFTALLEEIAALHLLDKGKGTYTNLVNQINGIIQQYNTRAKNRLAANTTAREAKKPSE